MGRTEEQWFQWYTTGHFMGEETEGSMWSMDKAKLMHEMQKRHVSIQEMIGVLGMSRSAFYRKCNGISEFKEDEIRRIVDYLDLESPMGIFFAEEVKCQMKEPGTGQQEEALERLKKMVLSMDGVTGNEAKAIAEFAKSGHSIQYARMMLELADFLLKEEEQQLAEHRRVYLVNRNIAWLLEKRGLSQADVAERAGFSPEVFSNIVRCKRKVYADEVVPIAAAMGVSVESLFKESASA